MTRAEQTRVTAWRLRVLQQAADERVDIEIRAVHPNYR